MLGSILALNKRILDECTERNHEMLDRTQRQTHFLIFNHSMTSIYELNRHFDDVEHYRQADNETNILMTLIRDQ